MNSIEEIKEILASIRKDITEFLFNKRKEKNLKLRKFSKAINIEPSKYCKIEQCKKPMQIKPLLSIIEALELTEDEIDKLLILLANEYSFRKLRNFREAIRKAHE